MEKLPFTVSARAARLIGRENVANAESAIIELVKNCYDADASISIINIDKRNDSIYIIDNGEGMTDDVIRKYWMTIGTDYKEYEIKTGTGRIKTGAKGIGRFALDRLGGCCEMYTKTINEVSTSHWKVDWGSFEERGKTIGEISADLEVLENYEFALEVKNILKKFNVQDEVLNHWRLNKGTIIRVYGLRDIWDDISIEKVYSNLETLIPPREEKIFDVYLFNSFAPTRFGKVNSTICEDYDYKLYAKVNEDKSVSVTIHRNELDLVITQKLGLFDAPKMKEFPFDYDTFKKGEFIINTSVYNLLPDYKKSDSEKNLEKIGSFDLTLYFMKRGQGSDEKGNSKFPYKIFNVRDRTAWLDKFGGIKIFRDTFRVRPYGEITSSSFDWLDLGKRALTNPTVTRPGYRVRPQQVAGIINISRIGNLNFEDKSSREGLQENSTFIVFKELIISLIELFERDRNQVMIELKTIYDKKTEKEKAKQEADEVIQKKGDNLLSSDVKRLKSAIEIYKEEIDEYKDEQKLLRVLASTGLIITTFSHELKNLSDRIIPRTRELRERLDKVVNKSKISHLKGYENPFLMLDDMRSQDERLKHWLDFSIAAVRKDKRSRKQINLVQYVENFRRMWDSLLQTRKVKLEIRKFNFSELYFWGHEIDLDSIFNNLIANSLDAFKRKDASNIREIKISFQIDVEISVVYEDSGPGLSEDIADPNVIFEPFFTTKRDKNGRKIGTGLGMWIVKSILDEYGGTFEFLNVRPGFRAKMTLPLKG